MLKMLRSRTKTHICIQSDVDLWILWDPLRSSVAQIKVQVKNKRFWWNTLNATFVFHEYAICYSKLRDYQTFDPGSCRTTPTAAGERGRRGCGTGCGLRWSWPGVSGEQSAWAWNSPWSPGLFCWMSSSPWQPPPGHRQNDTPVLTLGF